MQLIKPIVGNVQVNFRYSVHFTTDLFALQNPLLREVMAESHESALSNGHADSNGHAAGRNGFAEPLKLTRALFVVDADVEAHHNVKLKIERYFAAHASEIELAGEVVVLAGGERVKNEPERVLELLQAVNDSGLDRHSYMAIVGGGALLDLAGFAAAIAHRGIRVLRIPTTTLSQDDSGVGVKNGINFFGKKNFVGSFAPAWAVLNDFRFLETLPDREWRAGIAEAIKVALIKDKDFFDDIERDVAALSARDMNAMAPLIRRCAELHVRHICTGGDAFEMGSSRPLDFGHWSAHKLEQLTNYQLRHGEAVAIGLALDAIYSHLQGWLSQHDCERVLEALSGLGFELSHEQLQNEEIFAGLREFREHLGGELTIQMLCAIGEGFNVHEINEDLMREAIAKLEDYARMGMREAVAA